jgi:hypothetical protein
MRKLFILTASILFSAIIVKAQSSDPESDYIKKTYSKNKQEIVYEYMNLNPADSVKFWPLYGEYEAARQKNAAVRIDLINQYVNGYETLTPDMIDKLVKASFDNNLALDKLNSDSYEKIKKSIGAVKSGKYMQLEIYLQTMWRAIVQSNIPLIGALNNTKQN